MLFLEGASIGLFLALDLLLFVFWLGDSASMIGRTSLHGVT